MEISQNEQTLSIHNIRDLSGNPAHALRDAICAALTPNIEVIEIDLSQATHMDGCGVGALVSLYKTAGTINNQRPPAIRLLYPQPAVQQVLELTRLHHMFEVIPCAVNPVTTAPVLISVQTGPESIATA